MTMIESYLVTKKFLAARETTSSPVLWIFILVSSLISSQFSLAVGEKEENEEANTKYI